MKEFYTKVGQGVSVTLTIILVACLSPLVGAFAGWIMSMVFPSWIAGGFAAIGLHIEPSEFYKIGALLGWISPYIRTPTN